MQSASALRSFFKDGASLPLRQPPRPGIRRSSSAVASGAPEAQAGSARAELPVVAAFRSLLTVAVDMRGDAGVSGCFEGNSLAVGPCRKALKVNCHTVQVAGV